MKLAMQVIFDRLSEVYPDAVRHLPEPMTEVERPVAYEPGAVPERGRLYLCQALPAELCASGYAAICTEEPPREAEGNYIVVFDSVLCLLNVVQRFWDGLDNWVAGLEQLALRRGSVSEMLRQSLSVFSNPIFLIDSEFTLRAEAGEHELPQQKRVYRDNADSADLLMAVYQNETLRSLRDSAEPFLTQGRVLPFRAWIVNLFQDGTAAYQLVLAENAQKLRSGDGWLLKRLSEFVGYLLEQERLRLYTENGLLTHSETLLPMIEHMLSRAALSVSDVDLFAVSEGPGSFTGVRIGVSLVKGLAFSTGKPCVGVSTLEALSYNLSGFSDRYLIPVMDARRSQVYTAIFRNGERLTDDLLIPISELEEKMNALGVTDFSLCGDGYPLASAYFEKRPGFLPTPALLIPQNALSVALLAEKIYENAEDRSGFTDKRLSPKYLRASQAERERAERLAAEKN